MSTFALERIRAIEGTQTFEKLIINNQCQFDDFEEELKRDDKLFTELGKIYGYMEDVANGISLPSNKFKDITPAKELVKEYEFKSKYLRVYAIKRVNSKIIILGGYKNKQKREIRRFRSIKRRFLEAH